MTMEMEPEHDGIMTMEMEPEHGIYDHGEHCIVTIEMEPEHSIVTHGDGTRTRIVMTKGHLLTRSPTVQRCRQRALEINLFFFFWQVESFKNKNHSRIMPNYSPPIYPKQFVPN
jgi:hypothetical protein